VHVDRPISVEGRCGGRDSTAALMQEVVHHFERFIRTAPDQWFAFQELN
jgi:lauroyl/myristoyl acyltransferase